MKTETQVNDEVAEKLRTYRALDSPVRLQAFTIIRNDPGIAFNALAKELNLETGLAAYHIGVLKAAQVVAVDYERAGKQTTRYRLTDRGAKIYEQLFGAESRPTRDSKASKVTRATGRVPMARGR